MKIVVFNVRHGANLGDQLIAECLAAELRAADAAATVVTEDLAGRDAPQTGAGTRGMRVAALAILAALPGSLRQMVAGRMLDRLVGRRLMPRWRSLLADADAIVIGGGGIFADSDLNFPKKIAAALRAAAERDLPVAIHAVGVSPHWSRAGRRLFGEGLSAARLSGISVRDDRARDLWNAELSGYTLPAVTIAPDPALTLSAHFPATPTRRGGPTHIGLCLTSPTALRYHGRDTWSARAIEQWYCALAAELTRRGHLVVGFTTGTIEDDRFAAAIETRFVAATGGKGRIAPTCTSAAELVSLIGEFHGLVAHRLHALIVGYAAAIPGLALAWDAKMVGQMEMLGHPDRLLDPKRSTATETADRLNAIIADGVDLDRRDALIAEARASTQALVRTLRAAVTAHG